LSETLADLSLTASEINALANMADGDARMVSQLAAAAGTRPTTMTSVLDRLERRGLISRRAMPGDRRAVQVRLTASGRAAAAAVATAISALELAALADLPPAAIASLRAGLTALAEASS